MSVKKRLAKLTSRRPPENGPRVIYIPSPGDDARFAFIIGGGGNVEREDGESAATFEARAMMAAGYGTA